MKGGAQNHFRIQNALVAVPVVVLVFLTSRVLQWMARNPNPEPKPVLAPDPDSEPDSDPEETNQCTGCSSAFVDELQMQLLSCGHKYCSTCISNFVVSCFGDESVYLPKCCGQPIPYGILVSHLSPDNRQNFDAKGEEYGVPFACRVFCPNRTCSTFLGSSQLADSEMSQLTCSRCSTNVCLLCREVAHPGSTCNRDTVVQIAAQEQGWQKCPNPMCGRTVERSSGCHHITCHCGTEFCYLCAAAPWKTCACPKAPNTNFSIHIAEFMRQALRQYLRIGEVFRLLILNDGNDEFRVSVVNNGECLGMWLVIWTPGEELRFCCEGHEQNFHSAIRRTN